MVRLLHVLSVLAVVGAGCILVACAGRRSPPDDKVQQLLAQAGAVEVFTQSGDRTRGDEEDKVSPLVAQAEALAAYLNPPVSVRETPAIQETLKPAPVVRPPDVSPKFRVLGTSYFADEPKRSMALIWEPGVPDNGRWVKEGMQIGHVTIHEIRPGSIVYVAGEKPCEMVIEQPAAPGTTVAGGDQRPASNPRTAMNDPRPASPTGRSKRPTGSAGPTVGSARTAALD